MAKRRDNMLEAFKSSDESSTPPEPRPRRAPKPRDSTSEVGGPFAFLRQESVPGVESSSVSGPILLVALIFLLASAFLLGRLTAPSVEAAGSTGEDQSGFEFPALTDRTEGQAAGTPSADPASTRPDSGRKAQSEADRAFLDAKNKYTIRVLAYSRSERDQALAFAAYDHLVENDYPAVWPCYQGSNLFVFVGASPDLAGLQPTLERLWKTPGPGQDRKAYESAYIVNIGDYR